MHRLCHSIYHLAIGFFSTHLENESTMKREANRVSYIIFILHILWDIHLLASNIIKQRASK